MLERLEIRNFALIEDLYIDFGNGFNVLSGETGAGKSIILGAMNMLLGQKADAQVVRSGCDETVVSAIFHLEAQNPIRSWLGERAIEVEDDTLLIRRTVKSNGRGMIHVQGQPVTRADLSAISGALFDMSGQHDHQSLLSRDRQRQMLDVYGGSQEESVSYIQAYQQREALRKALEELSSRLQAGAREEDYLRFALEEIVKVEPKADEDEQLKNEVQVISQFEHIHENLSMVQDALRSSTGGAVSALHNASSAMARATKGDPSLADYTVRLESVRIECEDLYESIRDYLGDMSYSQERLDQLQDRLSKLQRLKKKYGPTLEDVLEFARRTEQTLRQTESGCDDLLELESQLGKAQQRLEACAKALTAKRHAGAKDLSLAIASKLMRLGMPSVVFSVQLGTQDFGPTGADIVDFMISSNPGEPVRPIKDIASGGELSRIMLSIKTVLAEKDDVETMVFDEVDAGIGGAVANAVGEQLQQLARSRQVIAITHLASIAALADDQFVVAKHVDGGRTFTQISSVKGDVRIQEIARMLSGDSTSEASLNHARELLGL